MSVGLLVCICPGTKLQGSYIYWWEKKNDFTNVANNKAGLSLLFGKNKWKKKMIFFLLFWHLVP
jgi:hypothetical protein